MTAITADSTSVLLLLPLLMLVAAARSETNCKGSQSYTEVIYGVRSTATMNNIAIKVSDFESCAWTTPGSGRTNGIYRLSDGTCKSYEQSGRSVQVKFVKVPQLNDAFFGKCEYYLSKNCSIYWVQYNSPTREKCPYNASSYPCSGRSKKLQQSLGGQQLEVTLIHMHLPHEEQECKWVLLNSTQRHYTLNGSAEYENGCKTCDAASKNCQTPTELKPYATNPKHIGCKQELGIDCKIRWVNKQNIALPCDAAAKEAAADTAVTGSYLNPDNSTIEAGNRSDKAGGKMSPSDIALIAAGCALIVTTIAVGVAFRWRWKRLR